MKQRKRLRIRKKFKAKKNRCSECSHEYGYGSMLAPPYKCPIRRGHPTCTGWTRR